MALKSSYWLLLMWWDFIVTSRCYEKQLLTASYKMGWGVLLLGVKLSYLLCDERLCLFVFYLRVKWHEKKKLVSCIFCVEAGSSFLGVKWHEKKIVSCIFCVEAGSSFLGVKCHEEVFDDSLMYNAVCLFLFLGTKWHEKPDCWLLLLCKELLFFTCGSKLARKSNCWLPWGVFVYHILNMCILIWHMCLGIVVSSFVIVVLG